MNSIINKELGIENNSMDSVPFIWIAIFKDSSKIEQFENEKEHLFKEVKDKINDLAYFNLTDRKGHLFSIDLINGIIGYNYIALPYLEIKEKKENLRLIFFRRHRVEMTEQLKEKNHTMIYFLGYQYNDKNGYNKQIILQINSDGSFIIE